MIAIGTSGYQYSDWRGTFYPDDLPKGGELAFYAERFKTVELNFTDYRIRCPPLRRERRHRHQYSAAKSERNSFLASRLRWPRAGPAWAS